MEALCDISFFFMVILYTITAQQFEYRYRFYMNSSTYTTNNSFSSNLNASLFSLYANATHKDALYTTNAGQNSDIIWAIPM